MLVILSSLALASRREFSPGFDVMEPWQLQPARDTGLTPVERFRSVRRENGLLESVAQQTWFSMLRIYFSLAHRLTISGREKLPRHGPFVLAANHCSHLDALVLGAALKPRHRERAFPIAAGDVFFQTTAVSVFSAILLNALPMWRKNCGPHALAELRRKLEEQRAIFIIFPEGGRSRTGSMMPFKHGLGMMVAGTNVPVVPCGLIGTFQALPAHRKIPRPVRIKLVVGEPLNFGGMPNNRDGWSRVAQSLESAVSGLLNDSSNRVRRD
jgi:1-acyl-sn-glycerol-3-phosphate acyltransferase